MIVLMRQLREELTEALADHLRSEAAIRSLKWMPPEEADWSAVASDCMDFMYGELGELYPDQPSKSGPSPESEPLPDPQE